MKFRFEVQALKEVEVDGFTDIEDARVWLIDNLDEECYDILKDAHVSNGKEIKS